MRRKLTRKDFAGLRQHYPVLSKEEMRQYVGGLNAEGYWENSDSLFTAVNPYATDFGVTPFSSSSYGYGDWDIDGGELPEVVIGGYYDGGYDAYEGYDIDGGELPEVEIGGSYPDDNENWNPEWDYYDPWPDDPDFDSTTGNDGYYDMGYWYEEYDGDNSNTGGSSGGGGGSSDNGGNSTADSAYNTIQMILNDPSKTNEQRWNEAEKAYRIILQQKGVNLFGIDFYFSEERGAKAWKVDNFSRNIAIGNAFFNMPIEDTISVLTHECIHVNEDSIILNTTKKEVNICYYEQVPENIIEYINNTYYNGTASELELRCYFTINALADPLYYKNEVNAYIKEKSLCPDVSEEYSAERDFRIWDYKKLTEIAETFY